MNCYAIFSAGRLALIETGSGDYLLPTAGKLQQNLAAAGIDPGAIEKVLLTHKHPDHSAGLTDPNTGRKLFPNAELVVHENEPRHWNDDTAMAKASERAKKLYFQCAREQMAPYHNVMHTFSGSVEVFPGITSVPLHGHTPGHSGYMFSSGKESLLIWGDIVHVPDIQIPRPEVTIEFDTDPHAAAATRKKLLDRVATDRQLVAGMHMHYPGFAHITKQGDSYLDVAGAMGPGILNQRRHSISSRTGAMGAVSDTELKRAEATGKTMLATELRAAAARYDRTTGRVVIELTNGCSYAFPAALVQDLQNASADELAAVRVDGHGFNLNFPALDVDLVCTRAGIGDLWHASLDGTATGTHRRTKTSLAKASAARANGSKGGRPRKAARG